MKNRILFVHVLDSLDNGMAFKDIVRRRDKRLLTMYIHRVYAINGDTVTELTHRNTIKKYTVNIEHMNNQHTDILNYMIQNLQKQVDGRFAEVIIVRYGDEHSCEHIQ